MNVSLLAWIFLLTALLGVYVAIAHDLRAAIRGYRVQTTLVALVYLTDAIRFADVSMWVALLGLVVIRILIIPRLISRTFAPAGPSQPARQVLFNPSYVIALCLVLAAFGVGVGAVIGGVNGPLLGLALATLLIGLSTIFSRHEASQQLMGVLTADNGLDLLAGLTLVRIPLAGDYAVFIDVAVAAGLLAFLRLRLRSYGSEHLDDFSELRG